MGRRRKQASRTLVVIVQDKSGSMGSRTEATISGFNEYKQILGQEAKGEILLTLTQFDSNVRRVHSAVALSEVPDLHRGSYVPGGMTALYDAVGRAVSDTERVARQGDKVIVVVMTDGGENSSHEWRHDNILGLFESKRAQGWEFIFLGAGEEAWDTGRSLGFNAFNSINYSTAPVDTATAFRAVATSTADVAGGQSLAASMTTNSLKAELEDKAGTAGLYVSPPVTTTATTATNSGTTLVWTPGQEPDDDDQAGTPVK